MQILGSLIFTLRASEFSHCKESICICLQMCVVGRYQVYSYGNEGSDKADLDISLLLESSDLELKSISIYTVSPGQEEARKWYQKCLLCLLHAFFYIRNQL